MRRTLIVPLLIGALAGTPAAAFASVRITSVTSPVYAGSYATVTAGGAAGVAVKSGLLDHRSRQERSLPGTGAPLQVPGQRSRALDMEG